MKRTIKGIIMEELGYAVAGTGGGCEAYRKDCDGYFVLITCIEGLDLPKTPHDICIVGFYRSSDEELVCHFECLFSSILYGEVDVTTMRFNTDIIIPAETKKEKPNCYECKHKGVNAGSAHIRCLHPLNKAVADDALANVMSILGSVNRGGGLQAYPKGLNIKANLHGVKKGWFDFPLNFDPVWLLNCNGFTPK